MSITQIRLDTQTVDATLTPAKISATATDDFTFPRDVTATRNVKIGDGSAALPSLAFVSDPNTGFFSQAADSLGMAAGGTEYLRITPSRVQAFTHIRTSSGGSASSPDIEVGSATTGIFSSGSSDISITVGSSTKLNHNGVQWETFSPVRFTNGSAAVASLGFTGDPTTGIYHPSSGVIALTSSGVETAEFSSSNAHFIGTDVTLDDGKSVILGNTNGALVKYSAAHGSLYAQTDVSNLDIASPGQLTLFANTATNGTGSFYPSFILNASGGVQIVNDGTQGSDGNRKLHVTLTNGVTSGDHDQVEFERTAGNHFLTVGYTANGTSEDGAYLRSRVSYPLRLGTETTPNVISIADAGDVTVSTHILNANGSAVLPSYTFNGDNITGMYHIASDTIGFATGGLLAVSINPSLQLDLNSHKIINVLDPTAAQDAATKAYVDSTGVVSPGVAGRFAYYPSSGSTVDDTTALTTDGTNVTVTNQLNIGLANKITFDGSTQVYLQSNASGNILVGHSATTGVNVFSLGSFGQLDLITQAQGAGFPKLSMSPDGTRGSVLWSTSGAGSVGSRYIGVQFDDDITNAFHSIERFARTSIASPYLELGYDADGSSVTGSRIRGSSLTIEGLSSTLTLTGTSVNITATANVQHVIPSANGTYDLGQATPNRWRDFYLNGQVKGGSLRPNAGSASNVALCQQGSDNFGLFFTGSTLHYSVSGVDLGELQTTKLSDGKLWIGNGSNIATEQTLSGDVTVSDTGVTTIQPAVVTGSKIASATITNTNVASGTFSAITGVGIQSQNLDMGTHKIINVTDPTSAQDAATKNYVDSVAAGLDPKASSRVITDGPLPAYTAAGSGGTHTLTATANGVLAVDGVNSGWTDITNDGGSRDPMAAIPASRVVVKDAVLAKDNGIYAVQDKGSVSTPWVLIRASDQDGTPANEVSGGNFTFVEEGTTWADTGWTVAANGNIVVDTDPINWIQFSAAGAINAGNGLTQSGATIDFVAGDTSLTVNANDVEVKRDPAGAIGLTGSGIEVNVDGATLEINTNAVRIKDAGVTYAKTNIVTRETPSGTVDGSNTVFTLANSCAAGSEHVFLNGILQDVGISNDYTISGSTITFVTAPVTGSKVRVTYWKA